MEGVFETTSYCPFTDICESYQTISRSERWMEKTLSQMRRQGLECLPQSEGGYTSIMLEEKLGNMKRVKDRCYRHNKRCLRFWQLERNRNRGKPYSPLRQKLEELDIIPEPVLSENEV